MRDDNQNNDVTRSAQAVPIPCISPTLLQHYFDLFCRFIGKEDSKPFRSFSYGFLDETEGYKAQANIEGRKLLEAHTWKEGDIGTGSILKRVIAAIEKPEHNLVQVDARYGEQSKGHYALLQARNDRQQRTKWEKVLFQLFRREDYASDAEIFDQIIELGCQRYTVITYLFFLKNKRRYVPNSSPETFDNVFHALGASNFSTARRCSWENYKTFLSLTSQVLSFLREEMEEPVDFLDAHSFLWVVASHILKQSSIPRLPIIIPEELRLLPMGPVTPRRPLQNGPILFDEEKMQREQKENTKTGRKAEELVYEAEVAALRKAGKQELSKNVRIVSQDMSLGYDISSYTVDGKEKHIEVKGTKLQNGGVFFLTANELLRSKEVEDYFLFVVTGIGSEHPKIHYVSDPDFQSDFFQMEPTGYRVRYTAK